MNFHIWFISTILAIVFLIQLTPAQAKNYQKCSSCHEKTLYKDGNRFYVHSPFAGQSCGDCHEGQEPVSSGAKSALSEQRKINWIGESLMADTSHGFLLPSGKVGDTLVVDMRGADGTFSRQEITVPLLADLPEKENPGKQPTISDVRVLKVERGVFLSATIGWQTDTLSSATVLYDEKDKDFSKKSEPSSRLGYRHEVVLYNLKLDKSYHFSVVSSDLFGGSQNSESMEFSTYDPYAAPLPPVLVDFSRGDSAEIDMTSSFHRHGTDYLFEISLAQPAAVYIGSQGEARRQLLTGDKITTLESGDESHIGLSSKRVISMGACRKCHRGKSTATHPVNVFPKPGMTVPSNYPTLGDGRITCSSCHMPHSSSFEYLSRKEHKRDLCVGCHKDIL